MNLTFSSASMDGGLDFHRIDVEKSIVETKGETTCAPLKNCSVPENQNSSISLGKITENQYKIWSVLERFRARRWIEASIFIE